MGDTDFGVDDYGEFFFEDEWLYIEDEVAFADELAETQIPSPGYSGTNAELMLDWYEYDTYEYFGELEYGSDSYWDVTLAQAKPRQEQIGSQSPRKRKRTSLTAHTEKRRRLQGQHGEMDRRAEWQNVVYRSHKPPQSVPLVTKETVDFALFPDWRERFAADADLEWHNPMPEDMKRAAEGDEEMTNEDKDESVQLDNQTLQKMSQPLARKTKKRKPVRMDEQLSGDAAEEVSSQDVLSSLDPEALRAVLKSQLGDAGMDEEAFMSVISNMLAEGGSADDAAAQLASKLLDRQDDDNEAALTWLQGRGVNVEQTEDRSANSESFAATEPTHGLGVDESVGVDQEDIGSKPRTKRSRKKL